MVIHTKERTTIHARGKQETRIKGRNVLTVTRYMGAARNTAAQAVHSRKRVETLLSTKQRQNMGYCQPVSGGRPGYHYTPRKTPYTSYPASGGRGCHNYVSRKPVRKKGASTLQMAGTVGVKTALDHVEGGDELYDACMTADFLTKPVKGTAQSVKRAGQRIKKINQSDMASGKMHASDLRAENIKNIRQVGKLAPEMAHRVKYPSVTKNMDTAQSLSVSGIHKKDTGNIFLSGAGKGTGVLFPDETGYSAQSASEKPVWENMQGMAGEVSSRTAKESAARAVKKKAQKNARRAAHKAVKELPKKAVKKASGETAKKVTKEAVKQTIKVTASAAGTAAGGAGGFLIGIAAGEAAGIKLDRHDMKVSAKKRMIQLCVAKLKQDENHDSIAKAVRDIVLMRFSIAEAVNFSVSIDEKSFW